MAVYEYADQFSNHLRELYGHDLTSIDLYNSNQDIQIINGKNLKIPRLKVSGYKDHTRGSLSLIQEQHKMIIKQLLWTMIEILNFHLIQWM